MGLVYSTETDRMCPQCEQPLTACQCKATRKKNTTAATDGIVRIQRQTQGRGGKVVTTITGVNLSDDELKQFAKRLKQLCGSGGTINEGVIEIQGDHRNTLQTELSRLGYNAKLAGG